MVEEWLETTVKWKSERRKAISMTTKAAAATAASAKSERRPESTSASLRVRAPTIDAIAP
ncbi:unannotated protein [freshwater metagenome]|uniref:Unannotated protein n=1 Tax=freshwater metagenome TaxID=449393 RepID=A0A6J7E7Q8_9ZZZZ